MSFTYDLFSLNLQRILQILQNVILFDANKKPEKKSLDLDG